MKKVSSAKTYADFSPGRSWNQFIHALYDRRQAGENMRLLFEMLREDEARIERKLGRPVEGLRILEIGPGQGMERGRYFGLKNEVIGIDLDVIPQGFQPNDYWRMLRENGIGRFIKTVGRKLILGRANETAWQKAVGRGPMRPPMMVHGDVCRPLPDLGRFDLIMSWSVFEHLPQPQLALENVVNLLNPSGAFYISLHLYTSHNGHHDIRAFTGQEQALPLWGHLRPSARHLIHYSSYLNEWRLHQWRDLFCRLTPDRDEFLNSDALSTEFGRQLTPEMRAELAGYSDEELYNVDAIYLWQKPET